MTNTSTDIVPMGPVHDWYSLRWQIEILIKTWKSFFHIHHCKKIKRELSEYKAIYTIKDYFLLLFQAIQKDNSYQRFSFACPTSYSKMGENLIDTRKKQSLIY